MRVYVGQTRARGLITQLDALGFGECTLRGELPPRRPAHGWFYDNGAFSDWQAGRPFDFLRWDRDMRALAHGGIKTRRIVPPDFVVLPDLVARGLESLAFSRSYLDGPMAPFHGYVAPVYLAVQDGMAPDDVEPLVGQLGGLFVGGSVPWKESTGASWCAFAHAHGLRCHVGRVGGRERVHWAASIGVDSIDSSLPLWSEENLERFVTALASAGP